jgi:hypothetical protein
MFSLSRAVLRGVEVASGFFKYGSALVVSGTNNYEDSQVPPTTQRTGAVAPNLTTGFRGDSKVQQLQFISSQADEVQFNVQLAHRWKTGTKIYPHVHFAPAVNIADGTYNVQFILGYRWADINEQYASGESTFTMTKQFTVASNNHIWKHFIAGNDIIQKKNIVIKYLMLGMEASVFFYCQYADQAIS